MKLYKLLTIGALAAMSLSSCSESFLDVESKTESNTENFYKTQNDAWLALVGCYNGWAQVATADGTPIYVASIVMSDECYGGAGNSDAYNYQVIDRFDQSQSPSDMNLFEYVWKYYYAGIYRCNELIHYDSQINWTDETTHGLYMGECRTLRALMYFDLVRLFGNIPFFLEPSSDNKEQADPAEVYAWILEDLRFAVNNIPANANHTSGEWGRITKQAAEGLLARVYMYYSGYYGQQPGWNDEELGMIGDVTQAEALAALEDAISSNYYALVKTGFNTLWPAASLVAEPAPAIAWDTEKSTYAGDNNGETMLAMTFTPGNYNGGVWGNRWQVLIAMRDMWKSPYGRGWGIATVCPKYLEKFEAGDTRLDASVIDLAAVGVTETSRFQAGFNSWREYTGYTVKKYSPYCYSSSGSDDYHNGASPDGEADFQIGNTQPWIFLRYADVLLMAAELGSPNAQTYMNQVRERAGLGSLAVNKENILAERAREFAFEGLRYWDLLRQRNGGQVTALVEALREVEGNTLSGGIETYVSYDADKILATDGLCQIPYNQITLSNNVLNQNKGW